MRTVSMARKPVAESVTANVVTLGTGALHINGSRVPAPGETITNHSRSATSAKSKGIYGDSAAQQTHQTAGQKLGRWPTNLILMHRGCEDACDEDCPVPELAQVARYYMNFTKEVGMSVPQDLVDYLYTMITPTQVGGESLVALDLSTVDWSQYEDAQLHGLVAMGDPTPYLDEIWRVLRPGAHIMMIAPDEEPTGHTGACALEDQGFEIRDALLLAEEPGHLHYVAKANKKERNEGCEHLAMKRQGGPTYDLREGLDEDTLEKVSEVLAQEGVDQDVIENLEESGIPRALLPKSVKKHFVRRVDEQQGHGNFHPCLHPEALVMTVRGYRPIQVIKEGDMVYSEDGRFHAVTWTTRHLYTSPDLFQIEVAGTNLKTLATDNHPFLVWRPMRDRKGNIKSGEVRWLPASEMKKGDYTLTPLLQEPTQLTEGLPEEEKLWFIFGLYLAEGVLQKAGHGLNVYPSFTLNSNETHLIERIKAFFEPRVNVGVYSKPNANAVQVIAFCPSTGALFRELGGTGAGTKSMHPSIWNIGGGRQRALLDGYFEGDGGYVRTYRQAKTVSMDLASQIRLLAEGLGYKANLHRYAAKTKGRIGDRVFKSQQPEHQIRLYSDNQTIQGRKPSRPTYIEHEGRTYLLRYVQAVTPVPYQGDVVNLSVEGSPTFQTAVGMSHNTVKPKKLLGRLLSDIPGEAPVLDPFMGSGSMGLACLETGHSYIGIEQESEYLEIADARVKWHNSGRLRPAKVESDVDAEPAPAEDPMSLDDLFGI